MTLTGLVLAAGLSVGGPDAEVRPSPDSAPVRSLTEERPVGAYPGDEAGPALFEAKPGRKPGRAERFQTVFAVSLPFSFLWSYAGLRAVESAQGLDRDASKALEKKTLVLSSASLSVLVALTDRLFSRPQRAAAPKAG